MADLESKNTAVKTEKKPWHGFDESIEITVPALGIVIFQ